MKRLLLIALLAMPAAADVFRWVDEDGVTHFGERPPESGGERIDVGPTNSSEPPEDFSRRLMLERKAREHDRQASGPSEWERKACQRAKDSLRRAEDTWRDVKRQGYTVGEQNYYEREIDQRRQRVDREC